MSFGSCAGMACHACAVRSSNDGIRAIVVSHILALLSGIGNNQFQFS